ncbi:MAG: hypothetical protein QW707_02545 [Candidatus Bathyarchaeia archaeon]
MGKYKNFIKKLELKKAPVGLFPEGEEKVFSLNSFELEGYPGTIMVKYVTESMVFHPANEQYSLIHPYDELMLFVGTNSEDLIYLGAKISICLGLECKRFSVSETSVAVIPANTPHGPIIIEDMEKPFIVITLTDSKDYYHKLLKREDLHLQSNLKDRALVKRVTTSRSALDTIRKLGDVKIDERGVMDLRTIGPGEAYQMVQMHPEDLEGINISFSLEFCGSPGAWMSTKFGHVHPEPELLVALGLDAGYPERLGASLEFWFGTEREVYVIDKPAVITIPRPWIVHTPLITQKVDHPFLFMLVFPGVYTQAGFVETGDDPF